MAGLNVAGSRDGRAESVSNLLDSPELADLIGELDELRWTGRKGYGSRALVGAALVKSVYAIPTWSRTAALIGEHAALQDALGGAPSVYACYRFATKLREHKPILDAALARIVAGLSAELPEYGQDIAIDASDLPAYANGQRYLTKNGPVRERYSDPDASWGHRSAVSTRKGGGYYGWKIHAAVCTRTGLPITQRIETARTHEASMADDLLQRVRDLNLSPATAAMDKGYDTQPVHDACHAAGVLPVIPVKATLRSSEARRPPSRRPASTEPGCSPGPTASGT